MITFHNEYGQLDKMKRYNETDTRNVLPNENVVGSDMMIC